MGFGGPARKFFYAADDPRVQAVSAAQRRVDRIAEEARRAPPSIRREPPPAPSTLSPSANLLEQRVAEELAYARRLLDSMGDTLSGDMGVLGRHTRTLQGFDIVGQILDGLASVVGARDKDGAIDRLGLEDLRNRLRRKNLDGEGGVPRTGAELEWGAEWMCEAGAKVC